MLIIFPIGIRINLIMIRTIRSLYKLEHLIINSKSVACKLRTNFHTFITLRRVDDELSKSQLASENADKGTIFDKIISKEIKADIIYEDEKCLAFNDISPQAPTHFLVIPKARIKKLDSCTESDSAIISHLVLTAKKIAKEKLPDGYRLIINNGVHGAQSIYHLHVHILGGRQMKWPPG